MSVQLYLQQAPRCYFNWNRINVMLIKVFSVEIYVYFVIMHLNVNSHGNKYLCSQRKSYNKETRMHILHNYVWISHVVDEDKTTPNNGLSFAAYSLATNANYDICKTIELMHVIILAEEFCMYIINVRVAIIYMCMCICMYRLQSFTFTGVFACTSYSDRVSEKKTTLGTRYFC